ncbi:MAG: gliding motility-associated C-terminal domain-containing protein [Bacteroidota bacterium]|nr:gliding motility-associated C-terminal domain-containing protein [Bacteroidota bacterium]
MIKLRNILLLFICVISVSMHAVDERPGISKAPTTPNFFTENKGQMVDMNGTPVPFVLFKAESPGLNMFITEKGLTYMLFKGEEEEKEKGEKELGEIDDEKIEIEWNRVDVVLKGATIKRENIIKEGESSYFRQFFLGHCANGVGQVHDYGKITIKEVYPGIDWVLYNNSEKGVKYDFVVHPNANPKDVELIYLSKKAIVLNSNGELEISNALGSIKENAPLSFLNGTKIASEFNLNYKKKTEINEDEGYETSISFNFPGTELSSRTSDLIIDPQLTWATFFGGSSFEGPLSLTNDASGNVFTCGYVASANYPTQTNSTYFQGSMSGGSDSFITKFSSTGAMVWSTYYGGSSGEFPYSLACDANGNLFVTGYTSSFDFPVQNSGTFFQGAMAGGSDVFILKFDNSGNRLWATFYGGVSQDLGASIGVDATGKVFVCGNTASANFPTQNSGTFFQGALNGGGDAFILKFDNVGNRLWATYYGGELTDQFNALTLDNNGNLFLAGQTSSQSFPTQNASTFFQAANAGNTEACIAKFDNLGNRLWATYYGGGLSDAANSIDCDSNGNVFASGATGSTNFPLLNAGTFFQASISGGTDGFIIKFNNLGSLIWSTYLGGTGNEGVWANDNLVVDLCNNVYVCFYTASPIMPLMSACSTCFYNPTFSGGFNDQFLTKFSNNGTQIWGTYFGGVGGDFRETTTVDNNGNFYVAGEWSTNSTTYPTVNPGGGAFYNANNNGGGDDCYIAKFASTGIPTDYTTSVCPGANAIISINSQNCLAAAVYTLLPGPVVQVNPSFVVSPTVNTTYTLFVSGVNTSSVVITQSAMVTVTLYPGPVVSPTIINGTCVNPITSSVNLNITFNSSVTPNYTVNWSPLPSTVTAVNSGTAAGLVPGINTVTITTSDGCKATFSFNVLPIPQPASFVIVNPSNDYTVTCLNPNVALTTSVSNGVPLSYTWFPSCTGSVVATSMNFNQACIGQVIGTSSTGCQFAQTFTVYQNLTSPTIVITPTVQNVTCAGGSGCFTLTSNLGPNVTTNWFQVVGTTTVYVGAAQGTINVFCAGSPGIYWGESVYNITGCKSTKSVQVTASVGVPIFTVTSSTNFTIGCGSKSVTSIQVTSVITSPVPNVAVNYTFMVPPVTGTPTTFSINPNLNNITIPGTYVVYIKDMTNSCVSSQSISIIQNTIAPNVNFIQPLSILTCKDPTMVLSGISSNTNTTITWTVPAIPSNSINPTPNATVVINPALTGASNVLTLLGTWTVGAVDNNNFCTATKVVQIVQDIRLPKFTISALTNSVINCKNADVVIVPIVTPTLAVALVPTYVWYPPVGGGLPGSQFNTTAPGTHTSISTSAINGCTFSATYNVASDLVAPNIEIGLPFILDCNTNPTVLITPTISGSTIGLTYTWTVPAGALTSNLNSLNLLGNQIGNYFISITNTINGCSSQGMFQVTEGGIKANFIVAPIFGYAPMSVTFTNTSSTSTGNSSITSTWGFGNGSIYKNIPNNVLTSATYSAPGTYSIILTVQKGSCIDRIIKIIQVDIRSKMEIPNVFTPNGDGSNDVFRLIGSGLKEVYIGIYDRWGRKVYELTSETGNFAWDGKDQTGKSCADGTYFYVIKAIGNDEKEFETKGNVSLFR